MSNIGKIESIIDQATQIVDHRGKVLYAPRIYTSLAWAGAVRVVGGQRFIFDLTKQLEVAEDTIDDPDELEKRKTEISDLILKQEKTIGEAAMLYAWAYPYSIKGYAQPKDIVKFLQEVQNIEAEQVADMRAMQKRIDAGRMTKKQAKKIVDELQDDAKERAKEQAKWFRANEDQLVKELQAIIKEKPYEEFDISDELLVKLLDKVSDKVDSYIMENEKLMFARSTTRRRRHNAEGNDSMLETLLETVDEMYTAAANALENAGYPVQEDGVH